MGPWRCRQPQHCLYLHARPERVARKPRHTFAVHPCRRNFRSDKQEECFLAERSPLKFQLNTFRVKSISLATEVLRYAKYVEQRSTSGPLEFDKGPISISTEHVSRQKKFACEVLCIAKYFGYRNTSLCEIFRTPNYFGPPRI